MPWILDGLDQPRYVVEREAGAQCTEVPGLDTEGLARRLERALDEAAAEVLVHHLAEATPRPANLRPELRRDVVIECECGTHIMMLLNGHHDVKRRLRCLAEP